MITRWRNMTFRLGAFALLFAVGCGDELSLPTEGKKADAEKNIIRISGSSSVYPLVRILAEQFEIDNDDVRVVFSASTHTQGGAAGVALDEMDIGLLSRPMTTEERKLELTYLHLAEDILVFATHRQVPVQDLSRQQLIDIYSGKITNWHQVGGHDAPIVVLDRPEHSSPKIVLRTQLFGADLAISPEAMVLERPSEVDTALEVTENAIGYTSLGGALLSGVDLNVLSIDGVRPLPTHARKDRYRYVRPFGIVVSAEPTKFTMRLVNFIYSEQGRQIMSNKAFVPITMDLVIAVQPEQNLLAQERRYAPLVDYLRRHLGMRTTVKLKLVPNYMEAIEEFQANRVNAAFLGSLAFGVAHAQVGVVPIARPEKDGVSQYRGLIVTRRDSGIEDWVGLKGKSFGMVDKATTAGYVFPLLYFREHGVERLEDYLGSVVFTGSHDLVFQKVFNGELDAGAAKDLILGGMAWANPKIAAELRILATSTPVPNNTFVLSRELEFPCFRCHTMVPDQSPALAKGAPRDPEQFRELIAELLLGLHESADGRRTLEALGADRFVKTTLEDLSIVNEMLEQAGFDPKNYNP